MMNINDYKVRGTNAILLIVLFLILGVYSCVTKEASTEHNHTTNTESGAKK
ncbi:MAG: hypothetical protein O9262_06465 [Cyclobacteriaceae bacterium]|nr:hypothetical protein [Cyclobacteriaceae bacterium]